MTAADTKRADFVTPGVGGMRKNCIFAPDAAAGLQSIVTGLLMDSGATGAHDFTYVSIFWLGAAIISSCSQS